MVVLGIGKVYKSTFVDIRTLLTSSAHARAAGGGGGGSFGFHGSGNGTFQSSITVYMCTSATTWGLYVYMTLYSAHALVC